MSVVVGLSTTRAGAQGETPEAPAPAAPAAASRRLQLPAPPEPPPPAQDVEPVPAEPAAPAPVPESAPVPMETQPEPVESVPAATDQPDEGTEAGAELTENNDPPTTPPHGEIRLSESEPDVEIPAPGAQLHDGFYLRVAVGVAAVREYIAEVDGPLKVNGFSSGVAREFAVGGTPWSGIVIGAALYTVSTLATEIRARDGEVEDMPDEISPSFRQVNMLGPFIDWYFDPKEGLHAQGALCLVGVAHQYDDDYRAGGFGLMLGAGYESWATDNVSVGLLARFFLAGAKSQEALDGVEWTHAFNASPQLLFTFTYH